MKKVLLALITLCLIFACFAACRKDDSPIFLVTFESGIGIEIEPQSVRRGALATPPDSQGFEKIGYTFDGWDYDFKKPIAKDTVIKAVWRPHTLTIIYQANKPDGAELFGEMAHSVHAYDQEKTLSPNGFLIFGMAFKEWNTEPDGGGTSFPDKMPVFNWTELDNAAMLLFAQWEQSDSEKPCALNTPLHLVTLSKRVNAGEGFLGHYFALGNDIDMDGIDWKPIGKNYETAFWGNLDGRGHTISRLKIDQTTQFMGLFGCNKGIVQNLNISGFDVWLDINSYDEEFICIGMLAGSNWGEISDCDVKSSTINVLASLNEYFSEDNFYIYTGGVAGENYHGTISHCSASVEIGTAVRVYSLDMPPSMRVLVYAGGIVGDNYSGELFGCGASGNVSVIITGYEAVAFAGGLAGKSNEDASFEKCHALGDVDVNIETPFQSGFGHSYAGGLVGSNSGAAIDCYAGGNIISAISYYDVQDTYAYAGGLFGECDGDLVTDCYVLDGQTFYRSDSSGSFETPSNTYGIQP